MPQSILTLHYFNTKVYLHKLNIKHNTDSEQEIQTNNMLEAYNQLDITINRIFFHSMGFTKENFLIYIYIISKITIYKLVFNIHIELNKYNSFIML